MLGILAFVINTIGFIPYVFDILWGKTRPNSVTWLIWSVLATIEYFAQKSLGATDSLWIAVTIALNAGIIFFLSLFRGYTKLGKFDYFCLIGAIFSLIAWKIWNSATIAVIVPIIIDFMGYLPTLKKTYLEPESENKISWTLATLAAFFGLLAVGKWSFILLIYPLFILVTDFVLLIVILLPRGRFARQN